MSIIRLIIPDFYYFITDISILGFDVNLIISFNFQCKILFLY